MSAKSLDCWIWQRQPIFNFISAWTLLVSVCAAFRSARFALAWSNNFLHIGVQRLAFSSQAGSGSAPTALPSSRPRLEHSSRYVCGAVDRRPLRLSPYRTRARLKSICPISPASKRVRAASANLWFSTSSSVRRLERLRAQERFVKGHLDSGGQQPDFIPNLGLCSLITELCRLLPESALSEDFQFLKKVGTPNPAEFDFPDRVR